MTVAVRSVSRKKAQTPDPEELLAWYDRHARILPWRARRGEHADPYRVWLSEIMLQQTTVKAVGPYYVRFLSRWPTVAALAAARLDDVLRAWAGLGYYARARNLHACAKAVVEHHGGQFPSDVEALRGLPGIGDYTAAAVAAIAFDFPAVPVDGNVETDRGACQFTTQNLRDNIVRPAPNRYLLTDVDGNRFDIPDFAALPLSSQNSLLAYL